VVSQSEYINTLSNSHPTDTKEIHLKDHKCFFVGGVKTTIKDKEVIKGSMYVEQFVPVDSKPNHKIVLIHGGGQTGVGFLSTPDGRRGWAHDFLLAGFEVFVVDQPGRGRSGYSSTLYGEYIDRELDIDDCERRFTSMKDLGNWSQAKLHSQWPENGRRGNDIFDQYMASQVNTMEDRIEIEKMSRVALADLLDRIGPAFVLGHSQGGPFCWLAGDVRPEKILGLIAVEPNGPPFFNVAYGGHVHSHLKNAKADTKRPGDKDWYVTSSKSDRPGGITYFPLTFDPPLAKDEKLIPELDTQPTKENLVQCYLQKEPVRKLTNLQKVSILILSAEASYHSPYDHGTSNFLKQAGVQHDFLRLEDHGIKGNGHMMMLEKNNHVVAEFILSWIKSKI